MIAAVVLAGGSSARMGKTKQTLPVGGVAMLERVLRTLRQSDVGEVVVVLGDRADEVRRKVSFMREKVVLNPRYADGLSGSLKTGVRSVDPRAEAAIIVLGDQPLVTRQTIDAMVEAYRRSRAPVVAPFYRGRRGNPVLFDRSLFPELLKMEGDVGAKSVVDSNASRLLRVEVDDRGVLIDVDTPEDYEAIESGTKGRTPEAG